MEGLGDLGRIFLDKTSGDIDQFLGVAVGIFNPQHSGRPHLFLKLCEEGDVGAAESIDGLPVVADSDNLCVAHLAQSLRQVKALSGDVLILVHNDVFETQALFHLCTLAQSAGRIVDHVFKIHRLYFLQGFLVLEIACLADLQEQLCADVLCGFLHDRKLHLCVTVSLEIGDKTADQHHKPADIAVALILQDLPEDLLIGTRVEDHAVRPQFLLQVLCQGTAVPVA